MTVPGSRPEPRRRTGPGSTRAAGGHPPAAFTGARFLAFADIVVDIHEHRIWRDGAPHHLTPRTFDTLLALISRPRELVDRQSLMESVWPDSLVTDNALTRCIKEVRQALGDSARKPRFVETVPRLGYRFLGEVTVLASFDPSAPDPRRGERPPARVPERGVSSPPAAPSPAPTVQRPIPTRAWIGTCIGLGLTVLLAGFVTLSVRQEAGEAVDDLPAAAVDPQLGSPAYLEYVQGRQLLNQRSEADRRRAVMHFRTAIELEPDYANAWSGLADALIALATFLPPRALLSEAMDAIHQALVLDPDSAAARVSLARMEAEFHWDFEQAEVQFRRALQQQPDYLPAHVDYAIFLVFRGRADEALPWLDRAAELDPLAPMPRAVRGWVLLMLGRVGEARIQLEEALVLDPQLVITHLNLGLLALREERPALAVEALTRARALAGPSPDMEGLLGYAEARSGQVPQARARLADLLRQGQRQYVPPVAAALIYLGLGEQESAIRHLRAGYGDRNWHLVMLKDHFLFDELRGLQEFENLVAAVEQGGKRGQRLVPTLR